MRCRPADGEGTDSPPSDLRPRTLAPAFPVSSHLFHGTARNTRDWKSVAISELQADEASHPDAYQIIKKSWASNGWTGEEFKKKTVIETCASKRLALLVSAKCHTKDVEQYPGWKKLMSTRFGASPPTLRDLLGLSDDDLERYCAQCAGAVKECLVEDGWKYTVVMVPKPTLTASSLFEKYGDEADA